MDVTPETTIAALIQGYQRNDSAIPASIWPHVEGNAAYLSTRDVTLRIVPERLKPDWGVVMEPTFPSVELGLTTLRGRFLMDWSCRMHPEDMECMAAVLLQEAQKARNARLSSQEDIP